MSKLKKEAERLLRAIEFEPVPLSKNKGKVLSQKYPRPSKKDRRHEGRYFPRILKTTPVKYSYIYENALEECCYDEWRGYRDGMRDKANIHKNLYPQMFWCYEEGYWNLRQLNLKLRKHERIRRLMRQKQRLREAGRKMKNH